MANEDPDVLKVLVASDNHLGYMERDAIRGNDSFITFEEILQIAKDQKVDFVLLGGDLFHENKPSRSTLYRTVELLRKYCMGENPVKIQILSDQRLNFDNSFGSVNYEDPNFNIELPVFTIHGNHDDPAGDGRLSAVDILSISNLVNYFGKSDNIDDISIYPVLLQKGETKVAIYGLGNIRDERLYRTFQQKKVKMMRPVESREDWFNIFVLHQNRVAHTPTSYVHEFMLDNFLDFVIWGHEHDCQIKPQKSSIGDFFICQPGSSVATSLSEGESVPKHVGILDIKGDQFRLQPIPLKTVRPFLMETITLSQESDLAGIDVNDEKAIADFLEKKVNELIETVVQNKLPEAPTKPLIRLRVDYSGFGSFNPSRFGQRFVGKTANPDEILLFNKKKINPVKDNHMNEEALLAALRPAPIKEQTIEDLITSFLSVSDVTEILPENDLHQALHNFVEKGDKDALNDCIANVLTSTQKNLKKENPRDFQTDQIKDKIRETTQQKRDLLAEQQSQNEVVSYSEDSDEEELLLNNNEKKKEKNKKKTTQNQNQKKNSNENNKKISNSNSNSNSKSKQPKQSTLKIVKKEKEDSPKKIENQQKNKKIDNLKKRKL